MNKAQLQQALRSSQEQNQTQLTQINDLQDQLSGGLSQDPPSAPISDAMKARVLRVGRDIQDQFTTSDQRGGFYYQTVIATSSHHLDEFTATHCPPNRVIVEHIDSQCFQESGSLFQEACLALDAYLRVMGANSDHFDHCNFLARSYVILAGLRGQIIRSIAEELIG